MDFDAHDRVLLPTTRERKAIVAADGAEVKVHEDGGGRWVVDATSQIGINPLGHRPPQLMEAMEQLYADDSDPLMVAGNDFYHERLRTLGETLTGIFPGDQAPGDVKAYFCNSGSEAVERGCLKAAQLYNGGNTYISCNGAFHGRTMLALSCNFSKAEQTEGFRSMARTLPIPFPGPDDDVDAALDRLDERITREGADNVNAVILEPLQGEGGYVTPHDDFLPGVRRITAEHGIPLIMDEVQAAMRTGRWFACEHWDIEPDMVAAAKAFSGGITPFGFALIKDEYATAERGKHGSTFGPNPTGCFVALKTIETIREESLLDHAAAMGDVFDETWNDLDDHDAVVDARGIGLWRGVEFHDADTRDAVLKQLYEEHDILAAGCGNDRYNPTLRYLPPLTVTEETVTQLAHGMVDAIDAVV